MSTAMNHCPTCRNFVLFGGVKTPRGRCCNAACAASLPLVLNTAAIPEHVVLAELDEMARGPCPVCAQDRRINAHTTYWVWSMVIMTRFGSRTRVSCAVCARKQALLDIAGCTLAGWWGFPWGVVLTPLNISRNVLTMTRAGDSTPTPAFQTLMREQLALDAHRAQAVAASGSPVG
ncbi:hypothetical protein BH11PLA1_BH11PLA1_02290 [soil metagenome]